MTQSRSTDQETFRNILIKLFLTLAIQYSFCEEVYTKLTDRKPEEENLAVCSILIEEAKNHDLDIPLVLGTAWEESRMTEQRKPNRYKCVGPLQIKYKYWCPNISNKISIVKDDGLLARCDLFYHGVKAFKYYVRKFKPLNKALCYYNNANKCSEENNYESRYVKDVNKHTSKIRKIFKKYKNL
jgi:hypothetical protein